MNYTYFESANGKFVVTGPGVIAGNLSEIIESRAVIMCRILNEAYMAGNKAKAMEIKKALEY